jgi:hypothetical protein
LLGTLGLTDKSMSEDGRQSHINDQRIKKLERENQQLQLALKQKFESRALKDLTHSQYNEIFPENEARKHMQSLERKVSDLIQENELILQENQELKDLSLSIINSTRRSSNAMTSVQYGSTSTRKHSEPYVSVKEDTFTSRDKELVEIVHLVEQKFSKENLQFKSKIADLERELDQVKEAKSCQTPSKSETTKKPLEWTDLDEANAVIVRLNKEIKLLTTRIDQLEAAASANQYETDKLYSIIESKTREQTDHLRERSIGLARDSYIDIGGLS